MPLSTPAQITLTLDEALAAYGAIQASRKRLVTEIKAIERRKRPGETAADQRQDLLSLVMLAERIGQAHCIGGY